MSSIQGPGSAAPALGVSGLEEDADLALLDLGFDDARMVRQQAQHSLIPGEDVRAEARESALRAGLDDSVEQDGAEPLTLVAVFQHESLCARRLRVGWQGTSHPDIL